MSSRSSRLARALLGSFSLWLASGCGAPAPDLLSESTSESDHAIKGGYKDADDHAVVLVYDNDYGSLCSGSLIAPNVVLTARHCVSDIINEANGGGVLCSKTGFKAPHRARAFLVSTLQTPGNTAGDYHAVTEVVVPTDDDKLCGNDQTILILKDSIDPSEAVPLTPRVDVELVKDEEYHAIGYGGTIDDGSGAGTRRRRDGLFIDCVGAECPSAFVYPSEWVGDQGICEGDSGGPALDNLNRVTGVTSRGSAGCESPVYGYVFGWAQWIKDTTIRAAGLGGYTAPAWTGGWPTDPAYSMPIGDSCSQPSECVSNRCLDDGSDSYCTRVCNAASPCPDGYTCDETNLGVCKQVHTKTKKKNTDTTEETTLACATRMPSPDPTKPIPWFTGAAALGAVALLRRRFRR